MSLALLRQPTEILSVIPASGAWALYRLGCTEDRYIREPVRAWALVRRPDGSSEVVGMVESDLDGLMFVDDSFLCLWNEATGDRCHCGYVCLPYPMQPDPWWCRSCPGLIVFDE